MSTLCVCGGPAGADPWLQDRIRHQTCLHDAAANGSIECIQVIMSHARDKEGKRCGAMISVQYTRTMRQDFVGL